MRHRRLVPSTKVNREAEAARIKRKQDRFEHEQAIEAAQVFEELEAKNIFSALPPEVREMIWRCLLVRPATILPGWIRWTYLIERKIGNKKPRLYQREGRSYKYQFNERRQVDRPLNDPRNHSWFTPLPDYRLHNPLHMAITVPTEPTPAQAEMIANGWRDLPFTYDHGEGTQVACQVVIRGNPEDPDNPEHPERQFPQVLNRVKLRVEPIHGVAMLRVCKQAFAECSRLLYRENTFAFDTDNNEGKFNAHEPKELTHDVAWIPGVRQRNGEPQTAEQFQAAMTEMFTDGAWRPMFVARDPMLSFFSRIGRVNTAYLTKVRIEGRLKTAPGPRKKALYIGFSRVLSILTPILKAACPNLKELALLVHGFEDEDEEQKWFWDHDPHNKAKLTDEDRIDAMAENVVKKLDTVKVLRLDFPYIFKKTDYEVDFNGDGEADNDSDDSESEESDESDETEETKDSEESEESEQSEWGEGVEVVESEDTESSEEIENSEASEDNDIQDDVDAEEDSESDFEDEWGRSTRWIDWVKQRARDQRTADPEVRDEDTSVALVTTGDPGPSQGEASGSRGRGNGRGRGQSRARGGRGRG
ncbi:uncharacterized protein LY89DRAFT_770728 [Mollisia scopiformis]|uniref:Uncharacterized protein n=1 Tax=Mollisia scopiformis TaxID=149040 RepID=A0A194XMQ7_MOLSC|nr:uncharacterized protein LY89DRAFT_770728 [Mollisia scopiformis]KUJ21374.1 hypothetical protein LY89DRAFT_770728 [Mollisia scopiformis]